MFQRTFGSPFRLWLCVSVLYGIQTIVSAQKARSHSWVLLTLMTLSFLRLPVPSIASFLSLPPCTIHCFPKRTMLCNDGFLLVDAVRRIFLILCCGIICTRCTANKSQYWCLNGTSSFEWHLFICVSVYNSNKGTSPYVSAPYYVFVWIYSYR